MKWIGLTGGIGSGKSTAAGILRRWSYPVIDADQIAKSAIMTGSTVYNDLVSLLGKDVLDESQCNIDRKKMAKIIFENNSMRLKVESIVHPYVQAEVARLKSDYERQRAKIAFYDVPLLFEKNLQKNFDAVVLIWCSQQSQIERIRLRNPDWSEAEIMNRLSSQMSLDEKVKMANFVVKNTSDLKHLELELKDVVDKIIVP